MKSNRKMAIAGTIVGALLALVGTLAGFYIGVVKPHLAGGGTLGIGPDKLLFSGMLVAAVLLGLAWFARRALQKNRSDTNTKDAW